MGILQTSLLDGATISVTGGTAATFVPDGLAVNSGIHLIDEDVADKTVQRSITAKSNPERYNGSEWLNGSREIVISFPFVSTDGKQKFPSLRIKLGSHPEMSDADVDAMCNLAAQSLVDTDLLSFWRRGSLA